MIDTLQITKRLEAANLSPAQAEAIAESIAQVAGTELATKTDLANLELPLTDKINNASDRLNTMMFGAYGLIVLGIFVNHFWR